ncbi:MAG: PP2C family protein-serine/threonine phosphatase, partial [Oscillospiraceae bacterium]|nr:PP2C family protein-serine/threonine phosphatase [Oscillospiraceae bacterium]
LANSIEKMTTDMISYIDNLTAVTAEKERIGAELSVATKIQASMLPREFPRTERIELFASMQPAKEVGGDFYDFFYVDENTLAVVMADVSGKGVPAALFMVVAKTLIKTNALRGLSPAEVFEISNNLLCENNDAQMFVTAFMGFLNIPTGRFTFVNAGHNPPILKRKADRQARAGMDYGNQVHISGVWGWLKTKVGFVLAGMEDMSFVQSEIVLEAGDELFLYTDGVTEAHDINNNLFSDPKLLEVANVFEYNTLEEFTDLLKGEIDAFAGEAPQADDITTLMLRFKG